jgi:hypothetical protein
MKKLCLIILCTTFLTQTINAQLTAAPPAAINFNVVPIKFYAFSDGFYIQSADKQYENAVGGKVLKIGNMETSQALEAIRPYVAYENELGFKSNAPFYLTILEVLKTAKIVDQLDYLPVTISKNGKEQTRNVYENG